MGDDTPEYLTVKKLQPQLRIGFKNNTVDLAIAFNAEGLIDEICYALVTQTHSTLLPIQKADKMFESVLGNIELSPKKFDKMKIILSRKKINEPIVKRLEEEYANQAKVAGATKSSIEEDKPKQRREEAPSPSEDVPENFSENFSPEDFAKWMKVRKFMLDKDCDIIKGEGLSGEVFVQLDESDLGGFKLTKAGFINLRGVWRQVAKTKPDSVTSVAPTKALPIEEKESVPQSAAAPDSTQQAVSQPPQDKPFVLEVPANLPDNFSEDFSPRQFAQWMKGRKFLPDEDCQRIIDSSITGSVFIELDEAALKDFGFDKAGFYSLRSVLKKVAVKTIPVDSDGKERPESESVPAMDRGEYKPKLKFELDDQVVELKPKQELKIPDLSKGYYPMQAKKHGVCLIINNKTFKDPDHKMRRGTDRDEYNLIETWRYLGYHVEVRREAKYRQIMKMLYGIDDMLSEVNKKSKSKVENDSFVCCILSHGNKFCIYSSDSKEIPIDDMERAVGGSDILRDKPKMFFIQACQGGGAGAEAVPSKLHEDKSGYVSDGVEIKTSKRSDIFISYAAAQGDQAYRHPMKGSLYVGALCKTFCEETKQCVINDLQMYINERVSDKDFKIKSCFEEVRQQPTSSNQLRRNVHFFFEPTP